MSVAASYESQPSSAGDIAARIERIPFSFWHVKARVLVGTATFFDAFDALSIAQVLPVLGPLWKLTQPEIGFMISAGYVGQLLGALFFGWVAERYGRIPALVSAIAIFSVMSVACGFAWDYTSLLSFRTIQGFGLGGEVPIAAVYISEIVKAKGRGRFVLIYENIFAIGVVLAGLVGSIIVPAYGWQALFFLGGLPIIVALLLSKVVPESPRWLAGKGRLAEAEDAVAKIEQATVDAGLTLPPVVPTVEPEVISASWRDLFSGIYLVRTLVVWTIWFGTYLIFYSLLIWLPTIYRTVFHLPLDVSLRYGLVANLGVLGGTIACALVVDIIGRRRLFTYALGGTTLCLFALWFFGANDLLEVVVLGTATLFFVSASSLALYVYTPELYPTRCRVVATALSTAWLRAASMVGPLFVGFTLSYGVSFVCLAFAAVALVTGIVATLFASESTGRVLEEFSP
jgi:MFS transporter, putative metabolite:H+ symporter